MASELSVAPRPRPPHSIDKVLILQIVVDKLCGVYLTYCEAMNGRSPKPVVSIASIAQDPTDWIHV